VVNHLARVSAQRCGAALVGAGVGAALVSVWTQSLAAQRRSCQQAGGLCTLTGHHPVSIVGKRVGANPSGVRISFPPPLELLGTPIVGADTLAP
jgi:hypothetical protein